MRITLACAILIAMTTMTVHARDLGTYGHTYVVAEKDLMSDIEDRSKRVDWKRIFSKARAETKKTAARGRIFVPRAQSNKTYYLNMTYVLDHDIKTYNTKGEVTGILYPKGFVYNVLDYLPVKETYVVFNGDRKEEVNWFKREYAITPLVYPIITQGNAMDVAEKLGRPVYVLRDNMKDLFKIEATVSVVYPQGRRMRVDEIVVQDENNNTTHNSHSSGRK